MAEVVEVTCRCQATFSVDPESAGASAECPRCGRAVELTAEPVVPADAAAPVAEGASWRLDAPLEAAPVRAGAWRKYRWAVLVALALLVPIGIMVVAFVLGPLRPAESLQQVLSKARTETEKVVERFLLAVHRVEQARANGQAPDPEDLRTIEELSVLGKDEVKLSAQVASQPFDRREGRTPGVRKGPFREINQFHESLGGYRRKQPHSPIFVGGWDDKALAPWMEKARDATKRKVGRDMARVDIDPDRGWKAIEEMAGIYQEFGRIASNAVMTYRELLKQTDVPLNDKQRELCLFYAKDMEKFEKCLQQDFVKELRSEGDYELYGTTVTVWAGSPGDPETRRYTYTLMRFQLEGLNTGWKIYSARPAKPDEGLADPGKRRAAPAEPSPGNHEP